MARIPQTSQASQPSMVFFTPQTSRRDAGPESEQLTSTPTPTPTSGPSPSTATPLPPIAVPAVAAVASPAEAPTSHPDNHPFTKPKLRLEIRDLSHPGATTFLTSITASTLLSTAVSNVNRLLYQPLSPSSPSSPSPSSSSITTPSDSPLPCPPTRSVTVILRDMPGVAYTTGTDLDGDHKEIHLSLPYVASITPASRAGHEITGVLTHELVHCYQWNARGTCPGGLVEGIADWVRLRCGLSPPHWQRKAGDRWDAGYQNTAYFLQYLEERFGAGTVPRLNERLKGRKYEEKPFWTEFLGETVQRLWKDYVQELEGGKGSSKSVDEGTQT